MKYIKLIKDMYNRAVTSVRTSFLSLQVCVKD